MSAFAGSGSPRGCRELSRFYIRGAGCAARDARRASTGRRPSHGGVQRPNERQSRKVDDPAWCRRGREARPRWPAGQLTRVLRGTDRVRQSEPRHGYRKRKDLRSGARRDYGMSRKGRRSRPPATRSTDSLDTSTPGHSSPSKASSGA